MRFPSRALWFGAWLVALPISLPGASLAVVLSIPEWLGRLSRIMTWPSRWAWSHVRGPQTKAERIAELQRSGFHQQNGAWVMNRRNRRAHAARGKEIP